MQEQQRQEDQPRLSEDRFLNGDNLLEDESDQEVSIHEAKKYSKRATQLGFGKLISSGNCSGSGMNFFVS